MLLVAKFVIMNRNIFPVYVSNAGVVYCPQAYNWLRKSANLILNLLSIMSDAGIADLSANPVAVLAKVEERFRLDLTDEMVSAMTHHEISAVIS